MNPQGLLKFPFLDYLFHFWDGYAFLWFIWNKYKYYTEKSLSPIPFIYKAVSSPHCHCWEYLCLFRDHWCMLKSENNSNSVISDFFWDILSLSTNVGMRGRERAGLISIFTMVHGIISWKILPLNNAIMINSTQVLDGRNIQATVICISRSL